MKNNFTGKLQYFFKNGHDAEGLFPNNCVENR